MTLNLSGVWPVIDSFSKGDAVESKPISFGDTTASLAFYPKGSAKNDDPESNTSLFLCLLEADKSSNDLAHEERIVDVDFHCGSKHWKFRKCVKDFEKGWGYSDFLCSAFLQANPVITVSVTMYCNPSIIIEPENAGFLKQSKAMCELSKQEGDVTLVAVKEEDLDQNADQQICAPPQKRRKISNQANQEGKAVAKNEGNTDAEDQENEVRVSSILLKAASPVFERMLESTMKESQEKRICVCAQSVDDVRDMIYYLWTNELRPKTDVFSVIKLAHYFELERLKFACINRIIATLSVDNIVDAILTFNRYSIEQGMDTLTEFAVKNKEQIIKHDRCNELPFIFKTCVLKIGNFKQGA
eukprot:CAMPEP_0202692112 /NCGR_PEP_ID=MMETSP1385-20130828/6580_1 /ASSEMBLY_ACC=CAM_ASM_000861 /TAXON_ID=933848 /ORGANISM="Elphidium margaritaceum" /LENGTH=356 /DNA_ID=CAMNT_0049347589 /DNA_START=82 /DNA_END=1152 /DNA_ORIENTATION=+